ncbi:hypothetical protein ACO1O0_005024 [Amphichorda felina]
MEVLRHMSPQDSSSWSFEALGTIFVTLLQHIRLANMYCIVDALDECDPDSLESFIQLTQQLQKTIPKNGDKIRFLFTSREYPRILASLDHMEVCPRVFVRPQVVAADIRLAMQDDFKKLKKRLDLNEEEGEMLEQALIDKSDGMFLWVSLAIKEIMTSNSIFTKEDLEGLIHNLPSGLRGLYGKAWAKALELLPAELISLARTVLIWLLLAERPLTIEELTVAVAVQPGDPRVPAPRKLIRSLRRFVLDYLKPFVEVLEDPNTSTEDSDEGIAAWGFSPLGPRVRLIHQSARESLLGVCENGSETSVLNFDLRIGHGELARVSLSYLRCEELQLGWFDLENRKPDGMQIITGESRRVVQQRLRKYPLLHYSANYWGTT